MNESRISTYCSFPLFHKSKGDLFYDVFAQIARARRMAQLAEGFGFDLTDAFACHVEYLADFLQRLAISPVKAEPQFDNRPFTFGKRGQRFLNVLAHSGYDNLLLGVGRFAVGNKVAD